MGRVSLLLFASLALAGCIAPLPQPDPQQAWVHLRMLTGRVVMAERLDKVNLPDGRYFQVRPGAHELLVRYDFDISGGGGGWGGMSGWMTGERICYLTVRYNGFQAGQQYRLETRTLGIEPMARLYDAKGVMVAEDSDVNCLL